MGQEKIAISDYLAIEQEDGVRYEFHEGKLFAMAGGSLPHTDISTNVVGELRNLIRSNDGGCKSFNSDMKIEIKPGVKYVYPDAGVSCPDHKESKFLKGAITNPRLVVEVTSPSSGDYDRGHKFRWYFSLPSVKEYLLISQDEPLVMLYRKHGEGDLFGMVTAQGMDESIELRSIGITMKLSEIYYGVNFPPAKASEKRE